MRPHHTTILGLDKSYHFVTTNLNVRSLPVFKQYLLLNRTAAPAAALARCRSLHEVVEVVEAESRTLHRGGLLYHATVNSRQRVRLHCAAEQW